MLKVPRIILLLWMINCTLSEDFYGSGMNYLIFRNSLELEIPKVFNTIDDYCIW